MRPHRYETRTRDELTERQRQILALMAAGHTNSEIADALGFTLDGAKWHVSEILRKLDVESREEAAEHWRVEHGLKPRFRRAIYALSLNAVRWAAIGTGVAIGLTGLVVTTALLIRTARVEPEPSAQMEVPVESSRLDTGKGFSYVVDSVVYDATVTRITYHLEGDLAGLAFLPADPGDPSAVPSLPIIGGTASGTVTISGHPPGGLLRFASAFRLVESEVATTIPVDAASAITITTPHGSLTAAWIPGDEEAELQLELVGHDAIATLTPGASNGVELVDDQGNRYPLIHGTVSTPARGDDGQPSRAFLSFAGSLPKNAAEVTLRLPTYEALIIGDWTVTVTLPD